MRPWWWRKPDEEELKVLVLGTPDGGKVLVTIRRDEFGNPTQQLWVAEEHAHNFRNDHWTRV
ncbi:MAG TPA: hypothetical protein PK781_03315 [Terrimesophilobacter sp.]|nr:hypothetical protein [Terrimesophilobacter sp.]HRP99471.1 hypothetical protein [Terrimesophilobacter sp.]